MKTTKYFLLTLFLVATKFGQAQTIITDMVVYPNPFNCVATIKFDLATNDTVSLVVYDRWGTAFSTFFTNTSLPSGSYLINFFGDSLPDGIYMVHFVYGDSQQITKPLVKVGSCPTTSTNDLTTDNEKFILYPNPTSDLLTIPIDGQKTILVTTLQGQIIKTIKTDTKTISLSDLATGNYILSVFNADNKLLATKQIVYAK